MVKPREPHLPIGTLLLPNDYQVRNGNPVSGLILKVMIDDELRFVNYHIHLSNGITKILGDDVIRDLFVVVR